MTYSRFVFASATLLSAAAFSASCAAPTPPVQTSKPKPAEVAPIATTVMVMAPPPKPALPPPSPPRPPPPVIQTAMAGEPSTALGEARLITSSCDNFQEVAKQQAQARIKQMHAEVDSQLKRWRDQQPQCWAEYRAQAEEERMILQQSAGGVYFGRGGSVSLNGAGYGYGSGSMYAPSVRGAPGAAPAPAREMSVPKTSAPRTKPTETSSSSSSGPRKADSASGTNNQVVGVDEADIVKTDGRYVYLAMNGALRIVEAMDPKIISVTKLGGDVRELFVEGDRAVVYSASARGQKPCTYGYDCVFAADGTATRITVLDIKDRAKPKIVRDVDLSGSLMAARRIGNAIHTVVADGDSPRASYSTWPDDLEMCGTKESVVRAKFAKLKVDNEKKIFANTWFPTIREKGVEKPLCGGLLRTALNDGQAFTTVVSLDMLDDNAPAVTSTVQSRPGAVFASDNTLYLSVVHQKTNSPNRWYSFYPSVDEASEIHAFSIGESPKQTKYRGSGVVPGHVLNQFAMDEWYGYLRVATTRGRVPDPKVSSVISILASAPDGNLVRVGAIDNIAPTEDIRAVRFDGDRGYIVTFKKTDPLFVMDLYDPAHPAILGELKIPGFSTYIHRIDPDHLLSIGFDANDHGSFAYFDGVILQLFDVRNATDPKLMFKEKIGTRGSSSEAATNHLAFNYLPDRGMLAIPMTLCEGGGDGRNGDTLAFSGLLVYDVNLEKGFTKLGGIDHGKHGASCGVWWSQAQSLVQRSVFLDELVYSIARDRAKVQKLGAFGTDIADIALMP